MHPLSPGGSAEVGGKLDAINSRGKHLFIKIPERRQGKNRTLRDVAAVLIHVTFGLRRREAAFD
jgi:hypothetical protein